jgi:hypothetical protein
MAVAETNRGQARFSTESTWGETPATPLTRELRITSESLIHDKNTVVSEIVISDRQRADILEVGQSASGDINYELSYGDWEEFFESSFYNTIASATVLDSSTTFTASTVTMGSTGTDLTTFVADQWVRFYTPGVANDGAVAQIVSRTSSVLTITGTTLTATVVSANVTGRRLRNGTTEKSFFIEVDFDDITAVKWFNGMVVGTQTMNAAVDSIVTGSWSFVGKAGNTASTTQASTVITTAGTETPMTATANVINLKEAGIVLSTCVQSIDLTIENNIRAIRCIGSKPAKDLGAGGVDVTGTMNVYLEDITLYNKMINHTETSLSFEFKDVTGNSIVMTIPSLYYTSGDPTISGQDADVLMPMAWQARKDPTNSYTVQVDFLPAT